MKAPLVVLAGRHAHVVALSFLPNVAPESVTSPFAPMDRDVPLRARKIGTDHISPAPSFASGADSSPAFYIPSQSQPRPTAIYAKGDRANKARGRRTFWDSIGGKLALGKGETRVLAGLTILGAVVRFWHIGRPSSVV